MVETRRHLHENPEVGLDLPDTHAFLDERLHDLGFDVETHPSSGLTVRIPGTAPDGVTSVLRADMDALPVTEDTGLPFSSRRPGAMHACGHDLHMAMLLGAATALSENAARRDTVLAFQPGEESDRGALKTLEHRNLRLSRATAFAIHVNAVLPAHSINYRRGTFMAHGDWFRLEYRGQGGHASQPQSAGNPIEAGAHFVTAVHALVDELTRDEYVVATVTESQMGNTVNVIPAEGRLRGTLRTLSPQQRERLIAGMRNLAEESADRTGIDWDFEVLEGYPATVNDAGYVDAMLSAVADEFAGQWQEMPHPSMVIEDFSYFLQRWPGAMVYLGANVPGHTAFNHCADVVFDEEVLTTGAALLLAAADGFSR